MEILLLGLLVTSTLTGLTVEAIKKLFDEAEMNYKPNLLAGGVSLVLSILIGCGYVFFTGEVWTPQIIIYLICMVFLSWLCAMVGYDKVIQTISQFASTK